MEDVTTAVRALLAARRYKAASRRLADADSAVPESERALLAGMAALGLRDRAAALVHLRQAVALRPDDAEAAFQLGHAFIAANDAWRAARQFERVAALAPGHPELREALAAAYRRDARYRDAVTVTDAALAAGNRSADILYERAVSLAHLGDAAGALAAFDARLDDDPEHAAAWFGSHATALEVTGIEDALRRLRRATGCTGAAGKYWGHLCATLRLLGRDSEADAVFAAHVAGNPKRLPLVEAVAAIRPVLAPDVRLFGVGAALLRYALERATVPGLVLEFGVRRGTSVNQIAEVAGQDVHGFDSFEGLPEGWVNAPQGVLTTGSQLPAVRPNVTLHAGWFEDTLPPFLAARGGPVRFVNIDSDIYSSAKTVLTALADRFRPSTVLVFDEYIGNRTWREDEYKAFQEHVREHGTRYEIIAVSPHTKQVAMRLL